MVEGGWWWKVQAEGGGSRHLGRHEVALVEQEDEVLVLGLLLEEGLGVRAAGTDRVARVEHLNQDVGRVDHLVRGGLRLGLGLGLGLRLRLRLRLRGTVTVRGQGPGARGQG